MAATLVTQEQVIEAVRPVQDPDLQRSLVELNMIKDITVQGNAVSIGVELTTPACPLRAVIEEDVRAAVLTLPGIDDVTVQFSHRVRSSGMGMPDKTPIPGVKNT